MFRQIVATTWADGVDEEQKRGFVEAAFALRRIPDVVSAHAGTDAGHFEGNYGAVTVLDFADFTSARRYVDHPDHQAFLATWVRPLRGERVVVQYDWGVGAVVGFHHVKIPVTDVERSRRWYVETLGFEADLEFVENGVLRGVSLTHPVGDMRLALREDAARAEALRGFDMIALAVGTRADLDTVLERATAAGATPGTVMEGREGWACDLADPDGIVVRLYTHERHG